ncbi:hypothetical protein Tco_0682372 [Tanacetum coccineum]|uniref:Uncharacterized protein n=1 Tax=Tanacetum coccineum TaxID=301880 RepID=A0ABQ4XS10_9ASTR
MHVLNTPIPDDEDDTIVSQIGRMIPRHNDDYVCRGIILNGMFDSLFDIYQKFEYEKELWDSLEAKCMAEKMDQDSDKPKGNNVVGPSVVNMVEHNNSISHKWHPYKQGDVGI